MFLYHMLANSVYQRYIPCLVLYNAVLYLTKNTPNVVSFIPKLSGLVSKSYDFMIRTIFLSRHLSVEHDDVPSVFPICGRVNICITPKLEMLAMCQSHLRLDILIYSISLTTNYSI